MLKYNRGHLISNRSNGILFTGVVFFKQSHILATSQTNKEHTSKQLIDNLTVCKINQKPIKRVSKFTYLGTNVSEQRDHSKEIQNKIEEARSIFNKVKICPYAVT